MPNQYSPLDGQGLAVELMVDTGNVAYQYAAGDQVASAGTLGADDPSSSQMVQVQKAISAARTPVAAGGTTDVLILAANALRKGFIVTNDANKILYLGFGTAAVTSADYTVAIPAKTTSAFSYESSRPTTFALRGVWEAGAAGNALVTEMI